LVLSLVAAACGRVPGLGGGAQPKTEDDKTLYALGLMLGRNVGVFDLSQHDLEMVQAGLADAVLKRKPQVELEQYQPKVQLLARSRSTARAEKEKASGKTAVEAAAREPGAVKLPSGMVIRNVKPGEGPNPTATDRVKVHYEGRLTDGTVFDSSKKRNQPATFSLGGVIKCWTEGLQQMKVGGKAVLTCPSDLAYGDGGHPPTIPGGATLTFDVELLEIVPSTPPPTASPGMPLPGGPGAPGPGLKLQPPGTMSPHPMGTPVHPMGAPPHGMGGPPSPPSPH
jgi:FKBP-type peptidyl-prolyl cis-trans isomerase FkpA